MEENIDKLNKVRQTFKKWLHMKDTQTLDTLLAVKMSHRLDGDPIWMMIIGASGGGKSEYLRALLQDGEVKIDDLTTNTFISGYKSKETDELPQFAEQLKNNLWYIQDMSTFMSKHADERSQILSNMRLIYDGEIKKRYGNKKEVNVDCRHNTLIAASTHEIDATMLEDQLLGTRFITFRMPKQDRIAVMKLVDENQDRIELMRESLNYAVREFEKTVKFIPYDLTPVDNQNLQLLANMTTLLRTAVSFDRSGEPRNLAYPEEPARVYKQLKKLYASYRMIGLSDDETLKAIRKICIDNINPVRMKVLGYLYRNNHLSDYDDVKFSTSKIHTATGLGKKTVDSNMHALNLMGMVEYSVEENIHGQIAKKNWTLSDCNLNLLFGAAPNTRKGATLFRLYRYFM
jgi:hypothetical protein